MLEGRKQSRTPERFLVQISAVHDPLLGELAFVENLSARGVRVTTGRSWEPGCHVEVKSNTGELARGRVVYCKALGGKAFAVGLDLLTQTKEWDSRSRSARAKEGG